jgi:large subunit ribosomal protein L1
MGKIRLKVVGDETAEKEQREEQKKRKEARDVKKTSRAPGLAGGQRVVTVGPSEEELETSLKTETQETKEEIKKEKKTKRKIKAKEKSKKYKENSLLVAKKSSYPIKNGVEILKKFKPAGFDESVELHINVKDKGITGQLTLPHGTGKKIRIKVADDTLIQEIEKGKINFDVLIAEPQTMPKLAKVARILGPRGLMPNPKSGTITDKPESLIEKLSKGQISYKTEAQAPIIHMTVGKLSFGDEKLSENIKSVIDSIGQSKILSVTLKSTMSPGIKLQV